MKFEKLSTYKLILYLSLLVLVFLVSISNVVDALLGNSLVKYLIYSTLIISIIALYFKDAHLKIFNNNFATFIVFSFIILGYLTLLYFVGRDRSETIFSIIKTIAIFSLGYGLVKNKGAFIFTVKSYVLSITLASVYYQIFIKTDSFYGFGLKNSFAPMVSASLLILIISSSIYFKKKSFIFLIIIIQGYTLFTLNSRASIISFFISIFFYILFLVIKKILQGKITLSAKRILIVFSIILLIPIILPSIIELIGSSLRINYLRDYGIDRYSAGRLDMIDYGFNKFSQNMLIGSPNGIDIESFFVEVLAYSGFIGFILFIGYFMIILLKIIKTSTPDKIKNATTFIFISLIFRSIFEQGGPFLPGTTHFIAWILIGYSLSNIRYPRNYGHVSKLI